MFLTWGSSESHLVERLKLGFEWQARAGSPLPEPVWPGDALEGHGSSWMIFFGGGGAICYKLELFRNRTLT